MPPKKKAAVSAKKETSDPIFGELVFCISRRASHKKTEIQQLIEQNGGKTSSTLSSATHLVIPDEDELEKVCFPSTSQLVKSRSDFSPY